jgi:hypothetical protein
MPFSLLRVRASIPAVTVARWTVAIVILALGGCTADQGVSQDGVFPEECDEGEPTMQRWGTDCLCCHDGQFSMAGSVAIDAEVAEIRVTDGTNQAIVAPNIHANFFRHVQLNPPLRASLVFTDGHEVAMQKPAPDGACNRCHDGLTRPRLGELR